MSALLQNSVGLSRNNIAFRSVLIPSVTHTVALTVLRINTGHADRTVENSKEHRVWKHDHLMCGNGNGKEWEWSIGIGISQNIGNGNGGKVWEWIAWEREGVGLWKPIPGHL